MNQEVSPMDENNSLFNECIEALGGDVFILKDEDGISLVNDFKKCFPIARWGRIDWDDIENKVCFNGVNEVFCSNKILQGSDVVYVFWDNSEVPIIKSKLEKIIEKIDEISAVGFTTWIFNPDKKYVIEIHSCEYACLGIK